VKEFFTKDNRGTKAKDSFYYRVGKKILMEKGEKDKWLDTVFIDTVKTFYTSTNAIRSRSFYSNGYQEGSYNFYHENGRLKEKGTYKESRKVGYVVQWTDAGKLKQALQYFYQRKAGSWEDSFKIFNYWDEAGIQIVKEGNGYCSCQFDDDDPLESGKVVNGFRDSVWHISSGDTIISLERYTRGNFISGESAYRGKRYTYVEKFVAAQFPGGYVGMMKFLQKNIRYPQQARRMGNEGKVFIKYKVDKTGVIYDLEVLKGVSHDLNKEAIRVIKLMPSWIPSTIRGIPTKSLFVLPVSFKLSS
jgi:TonB family protein